MTKRNPHLAKLKAGYLFPEIHKRKQKLLQEKPHLQLISLGIGDTTEPIPTCITQHIEKYASKLSTQEGYSGYGPEQGHPLLREKIAATFYANSAISPDEVFVSDGSKCDIGRLQVLFGPHAIMAVQDPSYPAYVDTSVMVGQTGNFLPQINGYENIVYMKCTPENQFFPDLNSLPHADILYFCSPNNPTGAAATKEQLQALVAYAKKEKAIIIYDAAYSAYIQNPNLPKSIFEIPGAKEVAIELGSFSKLAGFTGIRLAWSVVPKELHFEDGTAVINDWNRMNCTFFNGASNLSQAAGLAVLEKEGLNATHKQIQFYLENAQLIKACLQDQGLTVYGGDHAPYLWVYYPGQNSWDIFEHLLHNAHVVTTPGVGFGPAGEHFLRFSAYGHRKNVLKAISQLTTHLAQI